MTLIQVSQGHLNLLDVCPRKFQLTYLDQLGFISPEPLDSQLQQGQQFHQLMQQHWMQLDITPLLQASPDMQERFESFEAHPPELIEGQTLTEHRRMWKVGRFLLVGVFDLLILGDQKAQIVDWKSYAKPRSPDHLKNSWQTKLYPYILANTLSYKPEQISVTYWFSQSTQGSHTYHFPYDADLFESTTQEIETQLQQLDQWLKGFGAGQDLPQVKREQNICQDDTYTCPFLDRCWRSPPQAPQTNIDAIPECPI